jgi:putative membrane protein
MNSLLRRISCLAVLLVPLAALSQTAANTDPLFQSRLLNSLHEGNLTEIAAGRLAITRGSTPAVRQFGAELVKDHSTADGELVALAAKLNVVLPSASAPQDGLDELGNLTGRAFDRAFVKMMLDDHDKAVALVQGAQPSVKNGQLLEYLEKLLPVLERHRSTAMALNQAFQS